MARANGPRFDVAIVGGGIVGLAHAYEAACRGKRAVVIDRDVRANGASVRNFGFVTVTGQKRGESWRLARRTRDIWAEVAAKSGVTVVQRGLLLPVRRRESVAVLDAFLATEMGQGCDLIDGSAFRACFPLLADGGALAALWSPHELRVESRTAIHALAEWLGRSFGVEFETETAALMVRDGGVDTSRGFVAAGAVVVCPGDDFASLYPERIAQYRPDRCRLSMLRLASPGFVLPAAIMSDLSLVRYAGYAELPEAETLRRHLQSEQAAHLAHGVHLIVVQSDDGSLVVGDSHHYADLPAPFAFAESERLILDEFEHALGFAAPQVVERWTGTYAHSPERTFFIDTPKPQVRLVMVTSGTGASTAFGIAEKTMDDLFPRADRP